MTHLPTLCGKSVVTHHFTSPCGLLGRLLNESSPDSENLPWIRPQRRLWSRKQCLKHWFKHSGIQTISSGVSCLYTHNCTQCLCNISLPNPEEVGHVWTYKSSINSERLPSWLGEEKSHCFHSNRDMTFNHVHVKHNLLEQALYTILGTAYLFN